MKLLRRERPAGATGAPPYALLSYLLRYPGDGLAGAAGEVAALPEGPVREALERFLDAAERDGEDARARYVQTFDLRRRVTPHVTYYEHGDTRRRGVALLRLKRLYAEAGLPFDSAELPDHLAVILAFAALAPDGYGAAVLAEHRAALELLRTGLHEQASPYAFVLDAVVADLPALAQGDLDEVRRILDEGPPEEHVGLEVGGMPR